MSDPRLHLGSKPLLGYVGNRIERAAERRHDAAWLAALRATPEARLYAIGGEMVVLKSTASGQQPLFDLGYIELFGAAEEIVFLGLCESAARFAVTLERAKIEALKSSPEYVVSDLRSIAANALVASEHLSALAEAKALLGWHNRHRFCPNCGSPTVSVEGGWRRDCGTCKAQHFPRTDPVVIMLPVANRSCVLGRSYRFAPGMWSCLAGYMEPGETIEEAVRRETREEAGIVCGQVNYFASQPWPFPSSLMIGCHAEALSREIKIDRSELEDARWFDREEVGLMLSRQHPLGFTTPPEIAIAYHIVRAWLEGEASLRA